MPVPGAVYDILKVVLVTNDDVGWPGGDWTDGGGGEKQMIFPLLSSLVFQPAAFSPVTNTSDPAIYLITTTATGRLSA